MKNVTALVRATIGTTWFIAFLTLYSEISTPFHDFLGKIAGHHWTTKGLFSLILFFILYALFSKSREPKNFLTSALLVFLNIVLAGGVIAGFFIWNFFN